MPSKEDLNNDNLELFFVKCWEEGSKPGVLQARKWINHCLTKYGRPPLNKMARQHYASVLDTLTGMSKTEEWRDYVSEGAVSRTFCFALAVEFISLETSAVCIAYIVCQKIWNCHSTKSSCASFSTQVSREARASSTSSVSETRFSPS